MNLPSLFQRLKERKLVQWTVGYLAGAFVCLEAFVIVADQFGWALWIKQGVTVALLFGLAVTLVLAWHHGEKGRQEVSAAELILVVLLLASAGFSMVALRGRSQNQAGIQSAGGRGNPLGTDWYAAGYTRVFLYHLPEEPLCDDSSF